MEKQYKRIKTKMICPVCGKGIRLIIGKVDKKKWMDVLGKELFGEDVELKSAAYHLRGIENDYCGYGTCDCDVITGFMFGNTSQEVIDKIKQFNDMREEIFFDGIAGSDDMHSMKYPDYHDPLWKEAFLLFVKDISIIEKMENGHWSETYLVELIKSMAAQAVCTWMKYKNRVEDMIRVTHEDTYFGVPLSGEATWKDYDPWADHTDRSEEYWSMEQFCHNVWKLISPEELAAALSED